MLILFLSGFSESCQTQDNILTGEWNISWESQVINPPSFIASVYSVVFLNNKKYRILKKGEIVGAGSFECVLKDKKDVQQFYQLVFTESSNQDVVLSSFIQLKNCFIISKNLDEIFFFNEDMTEVNPYFLIKN